MFGLLGLGKPKRRRRRKRGGSALSKLKKVHDSLQATQGLSNLLDAVGLNKPAKYAKMVGYGKKGGKKGGKRKTRKRAKGKAGGSFLGDILGTIVKPVAGGIIGATGGIAQGLGGMGKRGGRKRGGALRPSILMAGPGIHHTM